MLKPTKNKINLLTIRNQNKKFQLIPLLICRICDFLLKIGLSFKRKEDEIMFYPDLKVQALSKREASKLKPHDRALLISIQDGDKAHLPFKERTNHITRSRYIDTLFCYFDDINPDAFDGKPSFPFAFTQNDAKQIINFLNHHFKNPENFDRIIIHCQAGISRSQAIALFVAKYFYKDSNLYHTLLNQKGKIRGGNQYIYNILQNLHQNKIN